MSSFYLIYFSVSFCKKPLIYIFFFHENLAEPSAVLALLIFVGLDSHKLPEDPRTESVSGDEAFGFALASDLWGVDAKEPYLLGL